MIKLKPGTLCPFCKADLEVYLETMGGDHCHYDNEGKQIYQAQLLDGKLYVKEKESK